MVEKRTGLFQSTKHTSHNYQPTFCVWSNNYGILATNVNPVTAPRSGTITAGDNWPQCTASCSMAVACSQRLLT